MGVQPVPSISRDIMYGYYRCPKCGYNVRIGRACQMCLNKRKGKEK